MAGRGLLPLLRLLVFAIALEASSSPSSYTSTHRRNPFSSLSPFLHSRVNGSTIKNYKMKRESPNEPGKVTNLQTKSNGTSMLVTWDYPLDKPLKGELECFEVSWRPDGTTLSWENEKVEIQNEFLINQLKPNTTYTIKVRGKNKGVRGFGEKSSIISTTSLGVPSQIEELRNPNATMSWLTVSWQKPKTNTGITSYYTATLRSDAAVIATTDSPQWNTTVNTTQAEFDRLQAGTKYTVEVRACNMDACGVAVGRDVWTRPAPPRLLGGVVDLGEPTESTMAIQLPLLANPPGWHYVMVQRQGTHVPSRNLEQELMNTAFALVVSEENNLTRQHRSVDSPKMYIAAKLQQKDGKRLQVTLGDNKIYEGSYSNQPLEKDAAYYALVVTEKKSGSWTERVCSVPLRFVATPNNTFEELGLAAGMAAMLLVIAGLAITLVVAL